jgi:hypothetical protein
MRTLLLLLLVLVAITLISPNPIMADEIGEYTVAGPISDYAEARVKCGAVLSQVLIKYRGPCVSWNGTWKNSAEGDETVCYYLLEEED